MTGRLNRPSDLPAERRRLVDLLRKSRPDHDEARARLLQMSRALAIAELYWATRDMARAALDASTDIPGWSVEALPSGFGILALEAGSLPPLPMGGSGQAFGLGDRIERNGAGIGLATEFNHEANSVLGFGREEHQINPRALVGFAGLRPAGPLASPSEAPSHPTPGAIPVAAPGRRPERVSKSRIRELAAPGQVDPYLDLTRITD